MKQEGFSRTMTQLDAQLRADESLRENQSLVYKAETGELSGAFQQIRKRIFVFEVGLNQLVDINQLVNLIRNRRTYH